MIFKNIFSKFDKKLDLIIELITSEHTSHTSGNNLLDYNQILNRMGLKSRAAFNARIDELAQYGLFRNGKRYFMFEKDLEKYLIEKRGKLNTK